MYFINYVYKDELGIQKEDFDFLEKISFNKEKIITELKEKTKKNKIVTIKNISKID